MNEENKPQNFIVKAISDFFGCLGIGQSKFDSIFQRVLWLMVSFIVFSVLAFGTFTLVSDWLDWFSPVVSATDLIHIGEEAAADTPTGKMHEALKSDLIDLLRGSAQD